MECDVIINVPIDQGVYSVVKKPRTRAGGDGQKHDQNKDAFSATWVSYLQHLWDPVVTVLLYKLGLYLYV